MIYANLFRILVNLPTEKNYLFSLTTILPYLILFLIYFTLFYFLSFVLFETNPPCPSSSLSSILWNSFFDFLYNADLLFYLSHLSNLHIFCTTVNLFAVLSLLNSKTGMTRFVFRYIFKKKKGEKLKGWKIDAVFGRKQHA